MMKQSRLSSLIEAVINTVIGFIIGILSQLLILPWFGIHISFMDNIEIGLWFTCVNIIRMYTIRRWFESRLHRYAKKISEKIDG